MLAPNPFQAPIASGNLAAQAQTLPVSTGVSVEDWKVLGLMVLGAILIIGGNAAANAFMINSIFHIKDMPSFEFSTGMAWTIYGVGAVAMVAGLLLIASQRCVSIASVICFLCPLAGLANMMGWPIRSNNDKLKSICSFIYVTTGSGLVGTSAFWMITNCGAVQDSLSYGPMLSSVGLQLGAAIGIGGLIGMLNTKHEVKSDSLMAL